MEHYFRENPWTYDPQSVQLGRARAAWVALTPEQKKPFQRRAAEHRALKKTFADPLLQFLHEERDRE
eukprot:4246510-Alexandrium_andersonii.AAC.1